MSSRKKEEEERHSRAKVGTRARHWGGMSRDFSQGSREDNLIRIEDIVSIKGAGLGEGDTSQAHSSQHQT